MKITVYYDIAKYPHIKLDVDFALKLLEAMASIHGLTKDLSEAIRVVKNFDEFYHVVQKKSGGFFIVAKDSADALRGRVVIHKVKLIIENGVKKVELILDRRVSRDLIESALKNLGVTEVEYSEIYE